MGMFDEIRYFEKLPDGFVAPPNFYFQTKDLENTLDRFKVLKGSRLLTWDEGERLIGPTYQYTGELFFYTYCTTAGDHEYFCKVKDGVLGPVFLSIPEMNNFYEGK